MLIPRAHFDSIAQSHANQLLVEWGHRMGPLNRPFPCDCFALWQEGHPVCVVAHAQLIAPHVGGGLSILTRDNTVELARLCSARPGLCRVGLRLWREIVFPSLSAANGMTHAISYQDAVLHSGNLYRFDGWQRAGYSSSGTDRRSGVAGRKIWVWPPLQ